MRKIIISILTALFFISSLAFAAVDLNKASKAELESLPGVGPATAKAIMAARPFKSVNELKSVKGIGDKTFDKLEGMVAVTKPKPKAKATAYRSSSGVKELAESEIININTASRAELERLPGVGPKRASAIISGRPYDNPEDVMKAKGIKEGTFAKIKDHITTE